MFKMFCNCLSLSSLPDISKWNTDNVNDMNGMLDNCILLLNISNLSILWKVGDDYFFDNYFNYDDLFNVKDFNILKFQKKILKLLNNII